MSAKIMRLDRYREIPPPPAVIPKEDEEKIIGLSLMGLGFVTFLSLWELGIEFNFRVVRQALLLED